MKPIERATWPKDWPIEDCLQRLGEKVNELVERVNELAAAAAPVKITGASVDELLASALTAQEKSQAIHDAVRAKAVERAQVLEGKLHELRNAGYRVIEVVELRHDLGEIEASFLVETDKGNEVLTFRELMKRSDERR
jgi:hypothetical protein